MYDYLHVGAIAGVAALAAVTAAAGSAETLAGACTPHGTLAYAIPGAGIDQLDPVTVSFAAQKNVTGLWEDPAGNAHLEGVSLTG